MSIVVIVVVVVIVVDDSLICGTTQHRMFRKIFFVIPNTIKHGKKNTNLFNFMLNSFDWLYKEFRVFKFQNQ